MKNEIMNLTNEQWKRISLGDLDNLIEEAKGNPNLIQFYLSCRSHLISNEIFKKRYGYGIVKEIPFPPEYTRGFIIDSRLQTIVKYIQKYNVKSILDVGSRAGFLPFHALKKNIINSAVGIEVDTHFYDLCNRAIQHYNIQNIKFYNCLFEDYESDEKFDAVILTDVLEHVIDPEIIVNKSGKFLKKDSILIVSLPIDRPPIREEEKKVIIKMITQEHVHLINLEDMIKIANNANFLHIETEMITSFWLTNISIFKKNNSP